MAWSNKHIKWLADAGYVIETSCGEKVPVFRFRYDITDDDTMSAWANHFRSHYCSDDDLKYLKPPKVSNSEYLKGIKFPSKKNAPGPSIRAGDFAEILVADYLEFLNNYYVPRTRYDRKIIGNESSKGSDVLAFSQKRDRPSRKDELLVYEVKAKLSKGKPENRLQIAIDHSEKDELRIAESLNAIKQRLFDKQDFTGVEIITRFQESVDKPYKRLYGAAAVISDASYSKEKIAESDTSAHPGKEKLELLVIHGKDLMELVNILFDRAADEA